MKELLKYITRFRVILLKNRMLSLFISSCFSLTGKQSSAVSGTADSDYIIQDCFFDHIGNWGTSTSPLWVKGGGSSNKITMTNTYFLNCRSASTGTFYLEGPAQLTIYRTGIDSCQGGSGRNAAMGYIEMSSPVMINLSSFKDNNFGGRNLWCKASCTFQHANVSGCNSYIDEVQYEYGNVLFDNAQKAVTSSFSNFEYCESQCGILYLSGCSQQNLIHDCNFLKNTVTGWGLLITENCGDTTVQNCIFSGNNYNKNPIFNAYSTIYIDRCFVDNMNIERNAKIVKWQATSKSPFSFKFFATANIKAEYDIDAPEPPTQSPSTGGGSSSSGSGSNSGTKLPDGSNPSSTNTTADAKGVTVTKKVFGIPMWALIVIGVVVVAAIIVGIVVYKLKGKAHHHKHVHKHKHRHLHHDEEVDEEEEELVEEDVSENITTADLRGIQ